MKFFDLNKKVWQWITLLFLSFVWGSSFILMKKGLEVYSHNVVAALRISFAFIVLIPSAFNFYKKIDKKYWKYLILTGVIGNGIPAFLFTKAQTEISSSLSGMLNTLTPIFTLTIGIILFKTKLIKTQVTGVVIGLLGAGGLIFSNGISIENSNIYYILFIVLATMCYAFSVNIIKAHLKEVNSIGITSLAFMGIGPFTIVYLFTTDFVKVSLTHPQAISALFYIILLAVFGTVLAVTIFNVLIKKTSTIFATSVTYLVPMVAIFWGLIDGEKVNLIQVASVIITLMGIYFINKLK